MSIFTIGGHKVMRSMSEPSDEALMHTKHYVETIGATLARRLLREQSEHY